MSPLSLIPSGLIMGSSWRWCPPARGCAPVSRGAPPNVGLASSGHSAGGRPVVLGARRFGGRACWPGL